MAVQYGAPDRDGAAIAEPSEEASVLAVVAHGLMNSIGVIEMASRMLVDPSCVLTDEQRVSILAALDNQVLHVREVLYDVIRGRLYDSAAGREW